jgi:hypothetical protein
VKLTPGGGDAQFAFAGFARVLCSSGLLPLLPLLPLTSSQVVLYFISGLHKLQLSRSLCLNKAEGHGQ